MNIDRTQAQNSVGSTGQLAGLPLRAQSAEQLEQTCRDLDSRGVKYSVVNGVPVIQQGFSARIKGENLFEQCLEMNRQAVVRAPGLG